MSQQSAEAIIRALDMQALVPEGGYWCPGYRSAHADASGACACGSILYLITPESFSHFHRLTVDEIFHFCAGDAVEQIVITPDGVLRLVTLGANIAGGHVPMSVVPAGSWQAARLVPGGSHALLAATTVPGYTDDCVTHASADEVAAQFAAHHREIMRFA